MPIINLSNEGIPISEISEPGTYHSTAVALSVEAQINSIKVGIGEIKILKKEDNNCIWTEALQSCFPVIFKFKNGDIGLFHSTGSSILKIENLLNRDDIEEIQLFEKGNEPNSFKVKRFIENLLAHYKNNSGIQPIINLQVQEDIAPYGITICYKSSDNKPIIIIGESSESNGLVNRLELCFNKSDVRKRYNFESITEKYQVNPIKYLSLPAGMERKQENYFQEENPLVEREENTLRASADMNHFFKKNTQERVDGLDERDKKQSSCTCSLL